MPVNWLTQEPRYIPGRFRRRRAIQGVAEPGFGRHPHQWIYVYTAGWDEADWTAPLMFFIAPTGGEALAGTEGQPGTPIDIGVASAHAVYHDGLWTAAPGGGGRKVWNTSLVHSITARTAQGNVAVRANRNEVSRNELVRILQSVDYGA